MNIKWEKKNSNDDFRTAHIYAFTLTFLSIGKQMLVHRKFDFGGHIRATHVPYPCARAKNTYLSVSNKHTPPIQRVYKMCKLCIPTYLTKVFPFLSLELILKLYAIQKMITFLDDSFGDIKNF